MYLFFLIFFSLLSFFSINVYLSYNFIFGSDIGINYMLILSIFSFFVLIYIFYKLFKDRKSLYIYLGFIITFVIYLFFYSYINIKEIPKDFFYNTTTKHSELTQNDLNRYEKCIEMGDCNPLLLYNSDITNMSKIIDSSISEREMNDLLGNLIEIKKKKDLLLGKGYDIKNNLNYDENYMLKVFLGNLRNEKLKSLDNIKNNSFFVNKKQLKKYIDEYYYFVYNRYINNDIDGVIVDKYNKITPTYSYFVNRENIYKMYFSSKYQMTGYLNKLKKIFKTIDEINDI